MKTNKQILFIITFTISTISMVSCGNDDDDNRSPGESITTHKRVADFNGVEYDKEGRIVKSNDYPSVIYGEDEIEVTEKTGSTTIRSVFHLNEDGLIASCDTERNGGVTTYTFEYDEYGRLIKRDGVINFIWDNDNIVKVTSTKNNTTGRVLGTYTYSTDKYVGNVVDYIGYVDNITFYGQFLIDYGYFGKRCKNLCTEYYSYNSEGNEVEQIFMWKYTLDKQGYITKVEETYTSPSSGYTSYPSTVNILYRDL